ncbi:MAG: hypothetical protein QNI99_16130 [Woeseiaceae bacterium]|nr:hypothetical protein [Woeseiaceae bacterium]
MNKLSVGLLLAAGLFFIDVTPAAAHHVADNVRVQGYGHGHYVEFRRRHEMPRWLRRNHDFRHWYRRSPLSDYPQISWRQLYDIYSWERRYFESRYYADWDAYGGRRDRDRRRHRHDD